MGILVGSLDSLDLSSLLTFQINLLLNLYHSLGLVDMMDNLILSSLFLFHHCFVINHCYMTPEVEDNLDFPDSCLMRNTLLQNHKYMLNMDLNNLHLSLIGFEFNQYKLVK